MRITVLFISVMVLPDCHGDERERLNVTRCDVIMLSSTNTELIIKGGSAMQLQAVNGYVGNGQFYPMDSILSLPERMKAVLTITDEPVKQPEKACGNCPSQARKRFGEALKVAQEQSVINGTSEMTLEEINEIIAECRREAGLK